MESCAMHSSLATPLQYDRAQWLRINKDSVTHYNTPRHTATHCDALRRTATHCDALRRTATHCDALRHTGIKQEILRNALFNSNAIAIRLSSKFTYQ